MNQLTTLTQLAHPCVFSPCGLYRYTLHRQWEFSPTAKLVVIGLNPSTANDVQNDPTIRRLIGFAKRWGCGSLTMLNLFGYRATDPKQMKIQTKPVGEHNDAHIAKEVAGAAIVLAAWGTHGLHRGRALEVRKLMRDLQIPLVALAINRDGSPKHPLYVHSTTCPQPYVLK